MNNNTLIKPTASEYRDFVDEMMGYAKDDLLFVHWNVVKDEEDLGKTEGRLINYYIKNKKQMLIVLQIKDDLDKFQIFRSAYDKECIEAFDGSESNVKNLGWDGELKDLKNDQIPLTITSLSGLEKENDIYLMRVNGNKNKFIYNDNTNLENIKKKCFFMIYFEDNTTDRMIFFPSEYPLCNVYLSERYETPSKDNCKSHCIRCNPANTNTCQAFLPSEEEQSQKFLTAEKCVPLCPPPPVTEETYEKAKKYAPGLGLGLICCLVMAFMLGRSFKKCKKKD